jgi:uncharacterized protein (DUF1697 family)
MNLKMPDLKRALEAAGFTDVVTLLSSGNAVFSARTASEASLQRAAEAAMLQRLGQAFFTIVRPIEALRTMLAADPYRAFDLKPGTKRVVTFLRSRPGPKLTLPIERHGARILAIQGGEVFSAYVRTPKGPVFMQLIEQALGKEVTTRTWETVMKVAR